ncbi:uncharacterized protein LOC111983684 isoform X2 [Quercus suber]|uniref:uncharacterized protein LOC111983684 isoform X2 n=1 Tax=Quercus suber TaxID=58331 RepID=UPI000CE2285B|nr:cytosolic 5'-nucleotidase 3A isoform X2 [Quercus suber]
MSNRLQGSIITNIPRTFTTVRKHSFFAPTPRVWFNSLPIGMEGNDISISTVASEMVVGDRELLDKKIAAIRSTGHQKLQVIADFDRTLTRWGKTHALLIEGGLTYDTIKQSVANASIAFREGVAELFEFLEERDIPVLIFSAGLADIIEEVLRQKLHRSFKNVKIVSNRMLFDSNGRLVSFKGKTIHSLNKNEHALDMAAPLHDRLGDIDGSTDDNASVKRRTNVLLLGDHVGDLGMSDGLNYETRISVGFLNDHIEKSLSSYSKAFDVVYLNDAPMWGVVKLVSQLCSAGVD